MPTDERAHKIQTIVSQRQQGILIIEDVFDPHNAAAAIRSCDAFGIQQVWFIFHKVPRFNPKKIGKASSTSANKWLDFKIFASTKECFEEAKKQGYETVGTILDATAESLFEAKLLNPKTAIVMGNEKEGLSEEAIALCDRKIYIPMLGFVQSLNLSVTASIFLYEMTRQRNADGMEHFLLPEPERSNLHKDFLEK